MISLADHVGFWKDSKDWDNRSKSNAIELLKRVNLMLDTYGNVPINVTTNSQVSGQKYGGFRPQSCTEGAPSSAHKEGRAVDIYDPKDALDKWLTNNPEKLISFNLFREHPSATSGWCHLTTRAPNSGKRTFYP